MDEAAEAVAAADLAHRWSITSIVAFGRPDLEGTMRPVAVVVDVDASSTSDQLASQLCRLNLLVGYRI